MNKYTEGFKEKIKPKYDPERGERTVEPFKDAQKALAKAAFSLKEREEFFTGAYTDILTQLFDSWLKTEPHCTKEREYLYHCAMALGAVKQTMIGYERYGSNVQFMNPQVEKEKSDDEQ